MELTDVVGQQALLAIMSQLIFIAATWWALQAINLEKIMKKNKPGQIRLLYILLTVVIGSMASDFFIGYLNYSRSLSFLFR